MIRTVKFVLSLRDDLTGKILKPPIDCSFYIGERKLNPIHKVEGYFVFTEDLPKESFISIKSSLYKTEKIKVNLESVDLKENLIVTKRLLPKEGYIKSHYKYIEGKSRPGVKEIVLVPKAKKINLKYAGLEESNITIRSISPTYFLGLNLMIREDEKIHLFWVEQQVEREIFRLGTPLTSPPKMNSNIVRVYRTTPCDEERFIMPLDDFYIFKDYSLIYIFEDHMELEEVKGES